MFLGIDASTQLEVLARKPHFRYQGKEVEPLAFLHDHNGVKSMRIRLWLNPYDEEGHPYCGGTNDYQAFRTLARMAMDKGYDILLDFHYSDFWCDPSKQMVPKAWRGLDADGLEKALYDYTRETLTKAKEDGIAISSIQVGNEITNGMLWPYGKLTGGFDGRTRDGYDNLARFLRAGVRACREILPNAKVVLHLERSGDKALNGEWFREISARGVDFDVIGLSYYPYWHGTFGMLEDNIKALEATYHKPIWIVETGYAYAKAGYIETANNGANLVTDVLTAAPGVCQPYPLTQEGQRDFLVNLIAVSKKLNVEAIYYWEPLWLTIPGLQWASVEGEAYIHESGKPTQNDWGNQCLFDSDGNATLGLDAFRLS